MVKTNKFENFKNALLRLNEMNNRFAVSKSDDAVSDALIKRFEFTYDLAWKSLKEFLVLQGFEVLASPRSIFAEAFRAGFLPDDKIWIEIIGGRNATTHIYSSEIASQIACDISERYCRAFDVLLNLYKKYDL